ncbi:MAG: DUF4131 domain-containing protein [Chitinophagaceae bacterium]|nr:MAG: DUF4131 domain-containing protein [Chitinophagaceae bacterium]
MNVFQYPLPKLCVAVIAGILLYQKFVIAIWFLAATTLTLLTLSIVLFKIKRDRSMLFTALLLVAGVFSGMLSSASNNIGLCENHFLTFVNETSVGTAIITERLRPSATAERYYANVASLDNRERQGKLLIYVKSGPRLKTGDRIAFSGSIKTIAATELIPGKIYSIWFSGLTAATLEAHLIEYN